jgi:hypothetical protein
VEVFVAYFKVLQQHFPGKIEENHQNLEESKPGPPSTNPRMHIT